MSSKRRFDDLVTLMDRLRGPDGCPWDREQTYASLRRYLLEECYEVADALDRENLDELREELGDLLFQIVFLSRLAKEDGRFDVDDVIGAITDKMIRRHPHVFGSERADTSSEVLRNWERIKREEKKTESPRTGSVLERVPAALPALSKAFQFGERAARFGFDWPGPAEVLRQVDAELAELREAMDRGEQDDVEEEVGDLFFTVAMAARHLGVDPERALAAANRKFRRRFGWIERELRATGVDPELAGAELLERLWIAAKQATDPAG